LAAAGTVGNKAAGTRSRVLRFGTWGVSGVLLARAAIGIANDLHGGIQEHYERLDLMIYSPLCLALGTGAALVACRAGILRSVRGSQPCLATEASPGSDPRTTPSHRVQAWRLQLQTLVAA
jgi:Protein of unknown function (DUF3995)